jgi:2,3-bisphosphoglycerate-independent phosphoglycerate mutase
MVLGENKPWISRHQEFSFNLTIPSGKSNNLQSNIVGSNIMKDEKYESLISSSSTKIIMLIMDGLGGLPREVGGKTELETAHTPNMDALAETSCLGLTVPIAPGVTPGSGPAHLALFGYDPLENEIGRGAMEALGVDFELGPDDLAARGNYCTIDADGMIVDRRAGRIGTEINQELSDLISKIELDGAELFIQPVKEHRFAFILRAKKPG